MSDTNDKSTGPGSLNAMESKLVISILANMQGTLSVSHQISHLVLLH